MLRDHHFVTRSGRLAWPAPTVDSDHVLWTRTRRRANATLEKRFAHTPPRSGRSIRAAIYIRGMDAPGDASSRTANPDQVTLPPDGQPEAAQPRWRQDFPIDWPEDEYVSRRDFVKFMGLVSLSFVAGQFWIL